MKIIKRWTIESFKREFKISRIDFIRTQENDNYLKVECIGLDNQIKDLNFDRILIGKAREAEECDIVLCQSFFKVKIFKFRKIGTIKSI